MSDLTYESLIEARSIKAEATKEFDLMGMANLALGILEQVNRIKGTAPKENISQGGNVMASRPETEATTDTKSKIDVDQILDALKTVKQMKGDIKITQLESLLNEHRDMVESMLKKV